MIRRKDEGAYMTDRENRTKKGRTMMTGEKGKKEMKKRGGRDRKERDCGGRQEIKRKKRRG